jgi:hypothetical protein
MIFLLTAFFIFLALLILTIIYDIKIESTFRIREKFRKKYLSPVKEIGLPTFNQMSWNLFTWTFKGWENWLDRKGRRK